MIIIKYQGTNQYFSSKMCIWPSIFLLVVNVTIFCSLLKWPWVSTENWPREFCGLLVLCISVSVATIMGPFKYNLLPIWQEIWMRFFVSRLRGGRGFSLTLWYLETYSKLKFGSRICMFNSLPPERFVSNLNLAVFKPMQSTDGWGILWNCPQVIVTGFTNDKSALVKLIACCHYATSHYLSQCWPSSLSPYGITRPQWINECWWVWGDLVSDQRVIKIMTAIKTWKKTKHDDIIKWKHFPHYWPFVRGIHRSPVNSPHKGQWHGALMFSLICA